MITDYGDGNDFGTVGTGPFGWDRTRTDTPPPAGTTTTTTISLEPPAAMPDTPAPTLPAPVNPFKDSDRNNWEEVAEMFGFSEDRVYDPNVSHSSASSSTVTDRIDSSVPVDASPQPHLISFSVDTSGGAAAPLAYDANQEDSVHDHTLLQPQHGTPLRTPNITPIKHVYTPGERRETAGVLDSPYIARRGQTQSEGSEHEATGLQNEPFEAFLQDKEKLFEAFSQFCRVLVSMREEDGAAPGTAHQTQTTVSQASTATATPGVLRGVQTTRCTSVATQAPGTPETPPLPSRERERGASTSVGTQFSSPARRRASFSDGGRVGGGDGGGSRTDLSDIRVWTKSRRSRGYSQKLSSHLPTLVGAAPTRSSTASSPYSIFRTRYVAMMDSPWAI